MRYPAAAARLSLCRPPASCDARADIFRLHIAAPDASRVRLSHGWSKFATKQLAPLAPGGLTGPHCRDPLSAGRGDGRTGYLPLQYRSRSGPGRGQTASEQSYAGLGADDLTGRNRGFTKKKNRRQAADVSNRKNPAPSVLSPTSEFHTKNPRARLRPATSIRRSSSARNTNMSRSLA
jgi:hypothetical protein